MGKTTAFRTTKLHLDVRCNTYSRDPQGIWLRLRFLKLHLFLFFAISYAASSTFYPVSLLNTSLTNHFHLNPLHRVSPGRTQPKTGTQAPYLCVRGTGTSLAVRCRRPWGTRIIYSHTLETLQVQFQTAAVNQVIILLVEGVVLIL